MFTKMKTMTYTYCYYQNTKILKLPNSSLSKYHRIADLSNSASCLETSVTFLEVIVTCRAIIIIISLYFVISWCTALLTPHNIPRFISEFNCCYLLFSRTNVFTIFAMCNKFNQLCNQVELYPTNFYMFKQNVFLKNK